MHKVTVYEDNYQFLASAARQEGLSLAAFLNAYVLPVYFNMRDYQCSSCGRLFSIHSPWLTRYCPFCGAQLKARAFS